MPLQVLIVPTFVRALDVLLRMARLRQGVKRDLCVETAKVDIAAHYVLL